MKQVKKYAALLEQERLNEGDIRSILGPLFFTLIVARSGHS